MLIIKSFKNYEEFKELFGIVEHGNGVKSRKNKILLACLKNSQFIHWWLQFREVARKNIACDAYIDARDILFAKNMDDFKRIVKFFTYEVFSACCYWQFMVYDRGVSYNSIKFADIDWRMWSNTMRLDGTNGLCMDGSTNAVRYVSLERKKEFKMKAGKFISRCIEESFLGGIMPEQMKRWAGEEFAREWQSYAEAHRSETRYELHVNDDFAAIYDSGECVGNFESCMVDDGYHTFYEDAVAAKAAYLTDKCNEDKIVARCIIYTNVMDGHGNRYCLAERQYATGGDTKLMQILIDRLLEAGEIDGYKRVGAGCYDNTDFILEDGTSLYDEELYIHCHLDDEDTVSFQDSFKYFDYDGQMAYNTSGPDHEDEVLNTTEGKFRNKIRDEWYADWMDPDDEATVYYHGDYYRVCNSRAERDDELCWSFRDEQFYYYSDCEYVEEHCDYFHIDDIVEDINGDWQLEEDCIYSAYHDGYILSWNAVFSEKVCDDVAIDGSSKCPVCKDWVPDDYDGWCRSGITGASYCCEGCKLEAEKAFREAHALRVVS